MRKLFKFSTKDEMWDVELLTWEKKEIPDDPDSEKDLIMRYTKNEMMVPDGQEAPFYEFLLDIDDVEEMLPAMCEWVMYRK